MSYLGCGVISCYAMFLFFVSLQIAFWCFDVLMFHTFDMCTNKVYLLTYLQLARLIALNVLSNASIRWRSAIGRWRKSVDSATYIHDGINFEQCLKLNTSMKCGGFIRCVVYWTCNRQDKVRANSEYVQCRLFQFSNMTIMSAHAQYKCGFKPFVDQSSWNFWAT